MAVRGGHDDGVELARQSWRDCLRRQHPDYAHFTIRTSLSLYVPLPLSSLPTLYPRIRIPRRLHGLALVFQSPCSTLQSPQRSTFVQLDWGCIKTNTNTTTVVMW